MQFSSFSEIYLVNYLRSCSWVYSHFLLDDSNLRSLKRGVELKGNRQLHLLHKCLNMSTKGVTHKVHICTSNLLVFSTN